MEQHIKDKAGEVVAQYNPEFDEFKWYKAEPKLNNPTMKRTS